MHKVFGIRENAEYTDREGAYLIPMIHSVEQKTAAHAAAWLFYGRGAFVMPDTRERQNQICGGIQNECK